MAPPPCRAVAALAALLLLATHASGGGAAAVLQMEAPRLVLPHLALNATLDEEGGGGSALRIGVRLTGAARQRVTAALDVVLPPAGAADAGTDADEARWAPADPSQLWLEPASLSWASSEGPSTKYVWLRSASELPLAWVLQDAAAAAGGSESAGQPPDEQGSQPLLRVRLVNATGAAIAQPPQNATTLVAAAADEGDEPDAGGAGDAGDASLPLFGFVANQVAYPPVADGSGNATARIPVRLLAGVLTETATVRFSLVQLPPPGARQGRRQALARQFLPTRATHGFLYFKPPSVGEAAAAEVQQEQQQQWIELPLAWDRIPPEAELRLGLELEGVYHARVAPQPGAVALHIFGTPAGTCPPGSALSGLGRNSSSGGAGGAVSASSAAAQGALEADGGPFGLSFNGSVIDLSSSFLPGVTNYGAEVAHDVANVTLCLRRGREDSGTVAVLPAAGDRTPAGTPRRLSQRFAEMACGCDGSGFGLWDPTDPALLAEMKAAEEDEEEEQQEEESEEEGGSCGYEAWLLPLRAGQNAFNLTLPEDDQAGSPEQLFTLTVVHLADPEHAELQSLTVKASGGGAPVLLCGPASQSRQVARTALDCEGGVQLPHCVRPCEPGVLLSLNVSDSTQLLSLTPALKHDEVQGVRVEVNGQVLSRGGDVAADQLEDTTAAQPLRSNASFLPSAFIVGLHPGSTLDAEVVVVAEDDVTTARYPIQFLLVGSGPQQLSVAQAAGERSRGWPLPPAMQPMCSICPAGWAAGQANSSACHMCPPGTHAPWEGSPACLSCAPGTFAYSWGSAHCKACIEGTYAGAANSSLCTTCPANTTTARDGQAACTVPLRPGAYQAPRYAVVVSFTVLLSGLDLEDVVVRAGVADVPPQDTVTNLIRADTAASFNISLDDVSVTLHPVWRRELRANVTATLGVEVPDGATDEDISAALALQRLSADDPIDMLASNPDRFFNRTTTSLDVRVEGQLQATVESRPGGTNIGLLWGLVAPGILAVVSGSGMVVVGCRRSRSCARWRSNAQRRLATTRLAPRTQQYSRFAGSGSGSGSSGRDVPAGSSGGDGQHAA